jgi:hypothetical protein
MRRSSASGYWPVAPGSVLSITGILANQFEINLGVPAISIALTFSLALLAIMVAPLLAIAVLLYSGAPAGGQTPGPSSATQRACPRASDAASPSSERLDDLETRA